MKRLFAAFTPQWIVSFILPTAYFATVFLFISVAFAVLSECVHGLGHVEENLTVFPELFEDGSGLPFLLTVLLMCAFFSVRISRDKYGQANSYQWLANSRLMMYGGALFILLYCLYMKTDAMLLHQMLLRALVGRHCLVRQRTSGGVVGDFHGRRLGDPPAFSSPVLSPRGVSAALSG